MLNRKQEELLHLLRRDARVTFTEMERQTGIPASTAFDNVGVVKDCLAKFVSLVDFELLGYPVRKRFLITSKHRKELLTLLQRHEGLNNLHFVNSWQAYSEHYFKNLREVHAFKTSLRLAKPKIVEIDILEELCHEVFVTRLHNKEEAHAAAG